MTHEVAVPRLAEPRREQTAQLMRPPRRIGNRITVLREAGVRDGEAEATEPIAHRSIVVLVLQADRIEDIADAVRVEQGVAIPVAWDVDLVHRAWPGFPVDNGLPELRAGFGRDARERCRQTRCDGFVRRSVRASRA